MSAVVVHAAVADDVELHAMAYDFAYHFVADGSDEALDGGCAELANIAALDADGMVMVS